jgi:hypothetical protein
MNGRYRKCLTSDKIEYVEAGKNIKRDKFSEMWRAGE